MSEKIATDTTAANEFHLCVGGRHVMAGATMDRSVMVEIAQQLDEAMDGMDSAGDKMTMDERVGAMTTSLVDMMRRRRPPRGVNKTRQTDEIIARAIYLLVHDDEFHAKNPKGVIVMCDPFDTKEQIVRVVGYDDEAEYVATVDAMREAGTMFGSERSLRDYH